MTFQTFSGEYLEGLAQRCAGHPQLRCEQPFVKSGAGREAALDDHVAKAIGRLFVKRSSDNRGGLL